MDNWELIHAEGWSEPEMTFGCSWYVTENTARVRCTTHDVATGPGHNAPGCCLPVAHLCSVCVREPVVVAHKFGWNNLCHRCRAIDTAIGQEHGASSATPFTAQMAVGTTLLGQQSGIDERSVYTDLRDFAAGQTSRLEILYAGPVTAAGRPTWDGWLLQNPPSDAAAGHAYARFVARLHPWLRTLEPRTGDVAWLTGLASLGAQPGPRG